MKLTMFMLEISYIVLYRSKADATDMKTYKISLFLVYMLVRNIFLKIYDRYLYTARITHSLLKY